MPAETVDHLVLADDGSEGSSPVQTNQTGKIGCRVPRTVLVVASFAAGALVALAATGVFQPPVKGGAPEMVVELASTKIETPKVDAKKKTNCWENEDGMFDRR